MKRNINDYVLVRLTDVGKEILRKKGFSLPKEDADGWSKWQLWSLMNTFGEYTQLGKDVPFETEIEIPE